MTEVMPEDFEPPKRGRKILVDATPLLIKVQRAPSKWVAFSTYNVNEVRSLRRQLQEAGCDVSVSAVEDKKNPTIFVMWKEENV